MQLPILFVFKINVIIHNIFNDDFSPFIARGNENNCYNARAFAFQKAKPALSHYQKSPPNDSLIIVNANNCC
jgi:hypothetical protein